MATAKKTAKKTTKKFPAKQEIPKSDIIISSSEFAELYGKTDKEIKFDIKNNKPHPFIKNKAKLSEALIWYDQVRLNNIVKNITDVKIGIMDLAKLVGKSQVQVQKETKLGVSPFVMNTDKVNPRKEATLFEAIEWQLNKLRDKLSGNDISTEDLTEEQMNQKIYDNLFKMASMGGGASAVAAAKQLKEMQSDMKDESDELFIRLNIIEADPETGEEINTGDYLNDDGDLVEDSEYEYEIDEDQSTSK